MLLIKEGLWENVNETAPAVPNEKWLKNENKARATIGLLVEDNQLIQIREAKTAREAWESLRKYHEKSTLTNKVFLLKKFCTTRLEEGGSMQQHMDTMLNLVHKLAALGEEVKDSMVVAMLLASLPDSYGTLITALKARSPEDLTIDFVKGKLIDEHQRRKNSSAINSSIETAMKATVSKNYSSRKSECFFCKKPGHQKKEYKKYLAWKAQREKETKNSNSSNKANLCFMAGQGSGDWFMDSGASSHMAGSREFFKNFKPLNTTVNLARRNITAKVLGIGTGVIKCLDKDGTQVEVTLKDVLYVPSFDNNVISVRKINKNGFKVLFSYDDCKIISEGRIVAVAAACGNNLYKLATTEAACLSTLEVQHKEDYQHQWHRKFGHRDINAIRKLESEGLASGIQIKDCGIRLECECCVKGKLARKPFPQVSVSKTQATLDLIHTDICGPMQTETPGNKRYILTILDDHSRYTTVHLMKFKNEATPLIKQFIELTKTQFNKKPKIIRSDQGREYANDDLKDYLRKEGIRMQYTVAYTPQQNGVAERKNRTLCEMARCMLIDADMHKRYWGEAVMTANYLQNILPTSYQEKSLQKKLISKI